MQDRAYCQLSIKSIDDEQRVIRGVATTPTPDRGNDVVDPFGVKFRNPLPFVLHHDKKSPVGEVFFDQPTADGVAFEARIPKVVEAGIVRDRVDEAWHSAKYGLLKGVSIGYRPLEASPRKGGGFHLKSIEVVELSMVAVPMNAETTILQIKALDQSYLAASGGDDSSSLSPAGVSAPVVRAVPRSTRHAMKTKSISDQITDYRAMLLQKTSQMDEMVDKSAAEGKTFDDTESQDYDALDQEVKSIEAHLKRLEEREAREKAAAIRVDGRTPQAGVESRGGGSGVIFVKPELPKGTLFTRYAMAVAAGKGSLSDTLAYAKRWDPQTPEVSNYIKAVAGTVATGSGTWGSELAQSTNLASEFIELLRPATVLGKIPGIRRVPFNVDITVQTGGSTVNWVGESAPKPVGELDFTTLSLGHNKIAGIVVLSDELVRLSTPNAEETVRRDLVAQVAKFMDQQFLDPAITATASRPASITNGVSAPNASGADADALYLDLNGALATFDTAETGTENVVIVTTPALARGISALRNALGQFEFGNASVNGGTLMGYPLIVSSSVPSGTLVLIKGDDILLADDGQTTLDASNQATLDLSGGSSPTFNLWQRNCVGIRAERWVTWAKRRSSAVAMIDTASYGPS